MQHRHSSHRRHRWKQAILAGMGGVVTVAILAGLQPVGWPLLLGSFGSSLVLLLGFPESGFSKAGRVIGAHTMCVAVGLLALHGLGDAWWSEALAVGASIALMLGFRLVHPPAGSNPLIVFAVKAEWSFLLFPTLAGSVMLVLMAAFWRRGWMTQSVHGPAHRVKASR